MLSSPRSADELTCCERASRRAWLLACAAFLVFLSLSIGFALTRQPWWDEGVFSDAAINFRNFGHLGSTLLDPHGYRNWPGVHHYTYWQFPLYLIALGAWLRFLPVNIFSIRLFSVIWACVYVFCWFRLVRCISRNEKIALLIASVVALDYALVAAASDGRMDMMCAALGQAGIAAFVCIRAANWSRAIFVAGCCGAASLFCHPMGAICNLSIAAVVLLYWREIRWRGIALAAVPYLIGAALYAWYIFQAPQVFLAQMQAASGYRVASLRAVLINIFNDFQQRYAPMYYTSLSGLNRLKIASLLFAVVGTLAVAFQPKLRRQPLGRIVLILACIGYAGVAALDNQKFPAYFVYSMPVMSACGALWVYEQWAQRGRLRVIASALLAGAVLAAIGGYSFKIYQNDYAHLYLPAVDAVRANLPPRGLVMGGSELGFALGFGPNLIDDRYIGFPGHRTPDVFVRNKYYGTGSAWDFSRQFLRTHYHLVLANPAYQVYVRNSPSASLPDRP